MIIENLFFEPCHIMTQDQICIEKDVIEQEYYVVLFTSWASYNMYYYIILTLTKRVDTSKEFETTFEFGPLCNRDIKM